MSILCLLLLLNKQRIKIFDLLWSHGPLLKACKEGLKLFLLKSWHEISKFCLLAFQVFTELFLNSLR